jgi:hypothetical protein
MNWLGLILFLIAGYLVLTYVRTGKCFGTPKDIITGRPSVDDVIQGNIRDIRRK